MTIIKVRKKRKMFMKMYDIFLNHLGQDNGISGSDLFNKFYGLDINNMTRPEAFYFWTKLQHHMNVVRKRTKMFIVHKEGNYFVATSNSDATEYRRRQLANAKAITFMLNRLDTAIEEKWYQNLREGLDEEESQEH